MIRILCADIASADEHVYKSLYDRASAERKKRADRYLRPQDKLRCVTAEALLRAALGTDAFRIQKNEFGKPSVIDHENFHYNLSHSGRYVVLAWGDAEVGVDVEEHCAKTDITAIAKQCFAIDEQEYVGQSIRRFYEVWTGKESYLKYTGEGLRRDMRSFSIFGQEPKVRFLSCLPDGGYSLSLCTTDKKYTFALPDVRQL